MEETNKQQQNQENQQGEQQPIGQEHQQQESQQQPQQQGTEQKTDQQTPGVSPNDIEQSKAITYLSYLGILFLVPMLAKKESEFAQFHAKQGLVLTIGWFLGSFLYIVFGLGALVHLAIVVFSIMGLVNVNKGEMKDLPIVGDLAKKFHF